MVIHSELAAREDECLRAAEAGKHVLVHLPLAASVESARRVMAACEQAGICLIVARPFRLLPAVREVQESLQSGKLGALGLLRTHRWQPPSKDRPTSDIVLRHLVHEIDLACWLFGELPTDVYACGNGTAAEGPDYVQLHLGFSGGMALADVWSSLPQGDGYFSLSAIGDAGASYADDHRNAQLLYTGENPSALVQGTQATALLAQLNEFVAAIRKEAAAGHSAGKWLRGIADCRSGSSVARLVTGDSLSRCRIDVHHRKNT